MSEQDDATREPWSRTMITTGIVVGSGLALGVGLWSWPEMVGWNPWIRWLTLFLACSATFSLGLLLVAIWGGVLEAIGRFFGRRP